MGFHGKQRYSWATSRIPPQHLPEPESKNAAEAAVMRQSLVA
jgi:hypothetical protein